MDILLIGGGGREHALARTLAQSPSLGKLWAAPGNPGIAEHASLVELDPADQEMVAAFARDKGIDLVVIGPEAPLVAGLADRLRAAGVPVFGPSREAARLEGSKGFTKDLAQRAGIPTARYERHDRIDSARAALDRFGLPVVIKADGLAAGKGVVVAADRAEAEDALAGLFQLAEAKVVIEEFLEGEEVSLFALSDGAAVLPFGTAQDHKRVGEGDTGPNTGGMGAYSPAAVLDPDLERRAMDEILRPTVAALAAMGTPYVGLLYAGLMLTGRGPVLIEYNCRFGDPEAQALLPRFRGDLAQLMLATATGRLSDCAPPCFSREVAVTVVLASQGYPGPISAGAPLRIGDTGEAMLFQAGTALRDGRLVATGGRVLAVTGLGETVEAAAERAYAALASIELPGGFWRRDIGARQIARERAAQQRNRPCPAPLGS